MWGDCAGTRVPGTAVPVPDRGPAGEAAGAALRCPPPARLRDEARAGTGRRLGAEAAAGRARGLPGRAGNCGPAAALPSGPFPQCRPTAAQG